MSTALTALNLSILKLASKTRDFREKTKKKTNKQKKQENKTGKKLYYKK